MATEGVRYIKIARIDKNGIDQTNTLQSLNQITIPYTSGDIVYTVVNITEKTKSRTRDNQLHHDRIKLIKYS